MGANNSPWTWEETAYAVEMYNKTGSAAKVAEMIFEKFGRKITGKTVMRHLYRFVPEKFQSKKRHYWSADEIDFLTEQFAAGKNAAEIAEMLNVKFPAVNFTKSAVEKRLSMYGFYFRAREKNKQAELDAALAAAEKDIAARAAASEATRRQNESLCWSCHKSGGGFGCPWVDKHPPRPVKGWTVREHTATYSGIKQYKLIQVENCPLFLADKGG